MMHGWELARRSAGQGIDLVSTWLQTGVIRSVQTGTIDLNGATTNTATITGVNVNNTILIHAGVSVAAGAAGALNIAGVRITLTNLTTVTATRFSNNANACLVSFFVLEFNPGIIRSVQRFGGLEINGGASVTQAITAVNTNKTVIGYLGLSQNDAGTYTGANDSVTKAVLTSSILVTLTTGTNPGVSTLTSFDVIEFY